MKNAAAKLVLLITILFGCAALSNAQTICDLSSKSAAFFLDLQTGMSPAQVQNIVGNAVKIKIKKRGERTFFQNFIKKPAPDSLKGIRALYLRFYDLKLYQIEIFYEPRPDLQTLDEIKHALSVQLKFPFENWGTKNNSAKIKCGEISLAADYVLNPRIELTDETVLVQIEALREKDEK